MTSGSQSMTELKQVRPYGDTFNDGMMQLAFTLPMAAGAQAIEAARRLLIGMGMEEPQIVHSQDLGEGFTYIVAFARTCCSINPDEIEVVEIETERMSRTEIDAFIAEHFGRPLVVVGACTGDDAHTVGIDAILNMKGVDQHYGLERYDMFEAHNLGSQVKNEVLIAKARQLKADAILISQIVTQKDSHLENLTNFIELAEAEGLREDTLLIVGGPRISHELALELGFDAGFSRGTFPEDVGSFIAQSLAHRQLG